MCHDPARPLVIHVTSIDQRRVPRNHPRQKSETWIIQEQTSPDRPFFVAQRIITGRYSFDWRRGRWRGRKQCAFFSTPQRASCADEKGQVTGGWKVLYPSGDAGRIEPTRECIFAITIQVLELKKKYPGTVLMIEVGYKYRFFGDDAKVVGPFEMLNTTNYRRWCKVASTELNIVAYINRNFLVASIPTHRRDVHLKKYGVQSSFSCLSKQYRFQIVVPGL